MKTTEMYEQVERIANFVRTSVRKSGLASGLQPVQIEALHYLDRCNRYSDTPVAVAEFLGLTKGTVSQTLGVLVTNGFVDRHPDTHDRRVVHLTLTLEGKQVLDETIPPPVLKSAMDFASDAERIQIEQSLNKLLSQLHKASGMKSFGVCKTCIHHQLNDNGNYQCGLTRETLSQNDREKICREHQASQ